MFNAWCQRCIIIVHSNVSIVSYKNRKPKDKNISANLIRKWDANTQTMWLHIEFLFVSFLVIIFAICSSALNYIFVAENEDFFEDCVNSKSNVLNFDGIVNKSELSFTLHDEVILVSGNVTFIWDIQPGDRVQV